MGKYLLWQRVHAAMTPFANITVKVLQIGPALTSNDQKQWKWHELFPFPFCWETGEGVSFLCFSMCHMRWFLASLSRHISLQTQPISQSNTIHLQPTASHSDFKHSSSWVFPLQGDRCTIYIISWDSHNDPVIWAGSLFPFCKGKIELQEDWANCLGATVYFCSWVVSVDQTQPCLFLSMSYFLKLSMVISMHF